MTKVHVINSVRFIKTMVNGTFNLVFSIFNYGNVSQDETNCTFAIFLLL